MIPLVLDQVHNILFLQHGNNLILPTEEVITALLPDLTQYRQDSLSIVDDLSVECSIFIHQGGEQPKIALPGGTTHQAAWIPAGELFSGTFPWEKDTLELLIHIYQKLILQDFSPKGRKFSVWFFGMDQSLADKLAALVIDGKKTGTAGLYDSYGVDDEPLPAVGEFSLVVNWDGIPQCIIETTAVTIVPFDQVSAEHARLEGEGDLSLDFWRSAHQKAFSAEAGIFNVKFHEQSRVVCEIFQVIKVLNE